MGILTWVILGLIVGALAKWIMPGDDPGGLLVTIGIGIGGAIVGGFISTAIGFGDVTGFNVGSVVVATAGALLLLFVYRRFKG